MPPIIVKVGGSLFDLPDVGTRLAALLQQHRNHRFLLFPGGGDAADLVRGWQPRFGLTDAVAHDLAVKSLDFNAALLVTILPGARRVHHREEAEAAWLRGEYPVLAPSQFLNEEERRDPTAALPHTWDVTSDSLAAWTACRWPAAELWMCKSVPCPREEGELQIEVDPHFTRVIHRDLPVRWCHLREAMPRLELWDASAPHGAQAGRPDGVE